MSPWRATVGGIVEDIVDFERHHARIAWGMTALGVLIGVALQALG